MDVDRRARIERRMLEHHERESQDYDESLDRECFAQMDDEHLVRVAQDKGISTE